MTLIFSHFDFQRGVEWWDGNCKKMPYHSLLQKNLICAFNSLSIEERVACHRDTAGCQAWPEVQTRRHTWSKSVHPMHNQQRSVRNMRKRYEKTGLIIGKELTKWSSTPKCTLLIACNLTCSMLSNQHFAFWEWHSKSVNLMHTQQRSVRNMHKRYERYCQLMATN